MRRLRAALLAWVRLSERRHAEKAAQRGWMDLGGLLDAIPGHGEGLAERSRREAER